MKRFATLVLFIASLGASIFAAEALLARYYEPEPLLELDEESFNPPRHYTPPENSLGFREQDPVPDDLRAGVTRILLLGDSFTWGQGVARGEDRFSDLVEAHLNQTLGGRTGRRYHVYNAGVMGTVPHHWERYLQQLVPLYQPDYVFAIFFLRDGTPLCTSLRCHRETIDRLRKQYASGFLYRHSRIVRLMGDALVRREFTRYYLDAISRSYLGSEADRRFWSGQQQSLVRIRDACQRAGIEFHLVVFPLLFGLESASSYRFHAVEDEILRFAREARIPAFSLTPAFLGQRSETLWVSRDDQHPNEKGHRIAADGLTPYMIGAIDR
jgi:lysophospholipase L1-like esterase